VLLVRGGVESNPGPTLAEERLKTKEYVLASLCDNAPEMDPGSNNFKKESIRDCIRLYGKDSDNSKTTAAKFAGINREILLATVTYLGGRDMNDYTKPAVITELIKRIDHHLPHSCNTCKTNYVINQAEESLMNCSKCGRGACPKCLLGSMEHPAAADNSITPTPEMILKLINPHNIPGWVYLCACCHKNFIPSPEEGKYKSKTRNIQAQTAEINPNTIALSKESNDQITAPAVKDVTFTIHEEVHVIDDNEDDDQPPVLVNHDTGSPMKKLPPKSSIKTPGATISPHTESDKQIAQSKQTAQPKTLICRFYQRNICKHGITGKGIPGEECKYSHPKRCAKYTAHGTFQGGCKKGKQCKDFHPNLCRDGLRFKLCTNAECRFIHIKGTKRTEPSREMRNPDESTHTYQQYEEHEQPEYNRSPNDHNHFLGVLNNLKQELFQMMEQKLSHYVPPPHRIMTPPPVQQTLHPSTAPLQNQIYQPQFNPFMPTYQTPHVHNNPQRVH